MDGRTDFGLNQDGFQVFKEDPNKVIDFPRKCPDCGKIFKRNTLLVLHRVQLHSYVPLFQCEECSIVLDDEVAVKKHLAHHKRSLNVACKHCDAKFKSKASLTRHVRYKHTYERPYKCKFCDYTCVECGKMLIHERIHTGEMPYSCTKCDKKFRSGPSLNRHLASHRKDRMYICQLCFRQFAILNTLKIHLRKIHAVNNAELDKVQSSKKHGLTAGLEKYLEHVGYSTSDRTKMPELRYYAIKPEFSDYAEHFNQVSFLIGGDSYAILSGLPAKLKLEDAAEKAQIQEMDTTGKEDTVVADEGLSCGETEIGSVNAENTGANSVVDVRSAATELTEEFKSQDATTSGVTENMKQGSSVGKVKFGDFCIPLKLGLSERASQLNRMKLGIYGLQPDVIKVFEDGTIKLVTDKYSNFLPKEEFE